MESGLLKKEMDCVCDKPRSFRETTISDCKRNSYPLSRRDCRLTLAVCVIAIVLLACWNAYVSVELVRLRNDVTVFTFRDCSCKSITESGETSDDVDTDSESYSLPEDEYKDTGDDLISGYSGNSDLLPEKQNHSLVKRSLGKPSKTKSSGRSNKRKGPLKRNRVKQLLKKNKAVAIHVQAKRTSDIFENRINVPGQKLTGWLSPDSKYTGFGTKFLLRDGYVTAPANGLYFVYSQVVFRSSDLPYMVAEIGVNTWGAAAFTKCQISANPNATVGSYVACHSNGVVYLRKGDGVSLIVNPKNVHVYMAPEYTYFGAFLLGLN